MPGIEKSRFVSLRASDEELLCGICLAILDKPLVTPCCSQTYCGDCLREWLDSHKTCPYDREAMHAIDLLQPPRLVKNMLDKLQISCDFHDKGCDRHVSLAQLKTHTETCRFNPEAICEKCGEKNGENAEHDCNSNLLAKNKNLEITVEELTKKHNAYFDNTEKINETNRKIIEELNKEVNDNRAYIKEIKTHNTELNESMKRLKSEKRVMNKRVKTMTEFSEKAVKQLNDSVKQSTELLSELTKLQQSARHDTTSEYDLDPIVNQSNRASGSCGGEKSLINSSFQYKLENLSSVRTVGFDYSPPVYVHGFKWRIMTGHYTDIFKDKTEYLKYFIECSNCNKSTKWSFDANVKMRIVGSKPGNDCEMKYAKRFVAEEHNWGFNKFITWSSLMDPRKGFVKDDSITLEVVISPVID